MLDNVSGSEQEDALAQKTENLQQQQTEIKDVIEAMSSFLFGGFAVFPSPIGGVAFLRLLWVGRRFSSLLLGGAAWSPPSLGGVAVSRPSFRPFSGEETKQYHPTEDRGKNSPTQRKRRKATPPNRRKKNNNTTQRGKKPSSTT